MNQSSFYVGIVESRMDPLLLGRVQVRVFGVHPEFKEDVPTEDLPWAICLQPADSPSLSGIGTSGAKYLEGSLVFLFFHDGESKQCPVIIGSAHGYPIAKSSFAADLQAILAANVSAQSYSLVASANEDTLLDNYGKPITTETATETITGCCSGVDASELSNRYGSTVDLVCKTCCDYGIKDPYAIIAILSNIAKESGFESIRESMNYSSVARLRTVFSSKFGSMPDEQAILYVNQPEKLANFVYAGTMGNGSVDSGDGWKYRGGGLLQISFKNNYLTIGKQVGVDLATSPDRILEADVAVKAAIQYIIIRFGGANRLKFATLEDALSAITKKINPNGYSIDISKVRSFASMCKIADEDGVAATKIANETAKNPVDPSNRINSSKSAEEINSQRTATRDGFADPNGVYPLEEYLGEQDTNRLSRRNTRNTAIEKRMDNRTVGIRTIGGTFDEPQPAYNAKYPYNLVKTTESGHTIELDDTPGNERIHFFHTKGGYEETDRFGNKVTKIIGDGYTIVDRNGYISIAGKARVTIGGDCDLVVGGNVNMEVDGHMTVDAGGDIMLKSGGKLLVDTAEGVSVRSDNLISLDGSQVHWNSGLSTAIGNSKRYASGIDFEKQIPENFLGATTLELDGLDESEAAEGISKAISSGTITQREIDEGKAASSIETDTKEAFSKSEIAKSCAMFVKGNINDTLQISKYYSLDMLSSKAIVSKYRIIDNNNLTDSEIACNLKSLAENCLDKIKAQYPEMIVTSGFRAGNNSSQHTLGQAADMQFPGRTKSEYFEIAQWIRDNVPFDKLILEYKTTETRQPWIHISFVYGGNNNKVLTYMNHRKFGDGLHKLEA